MTTHLQPSPRPATENPAPPTARPTRGVRVRTGVAAGAGSIWREGNVSSGDDWQKHNT